MADIKTTKAQPEVSDMAEAYTEKVAVSEHELELERALQNYVPDSAAEKALVRKIDLYMVAYFLCYPAACSGSSMEPQCSPY